MRKTPDCTVWRASPTAAMRGRPTRAVKASRACCRHIRQRSTPARSRPCAMRRALALRGRRLAEPQIIRAVPARPLADDQVRVVTPSGAAVVARQRLAHVVALIAEVEAQDRAAHADVGRDVYQLVATHAEALGPERHHLHETHRARGGYRPAIEAALDIDDRHDQARWQTRLPPPVRFAIHLLENIETLVFLLDDAPQPRLHERVPDGGVVLVGEALRLPDRLRDHRLQLRVTLLVGARGLPYGDPQGGERDNKERAHPHAARCGLKSRGARA